MTLPTGTRLGPYEILAPLGAGGMGEVYRARDTRLGRDVAVKVLPEAVAAHPDRLACMEREARTVAALNHPNIVTLHSIEESGGVRFLTMELVEGESLDRLVTPGGLPTARVLAFAVPLADALVAAHERAVVHRDLKPANIMVTRDGRLKVLDFGLAKAALPESGLEATQAETLVTPVSTAGQVVGTVPYMAPEQLRGEPADARTDLFALGVLLYELLAGRRPFGGANAADVSSAILRDPPEPLTALRGDLPAGLGRIVGRCLEKDPERRVQTAKDVRNELDLVRREVESGGAPSASGTAAAPREVPSIAVLPFVNRSRDEEDQYFADGLADELLNVLAKIRGLRVAARTSSFSFKGKDVTIADIGRTLQVASVLEGSVRKSGNRVRIAVQLVAVADGYHLWSETYDRTLDDIFAVQDDIAQAVVKELRAALFGDEPDSKASGEVKAEVAAAAAGRGTDPEAHRLFLQGRFLVNRLTREDVTRGVEFLRRALVLDNGHAQAWAWLSRAHSLEAGWGLLPVDEGNARALEAARRALELEPHLAEGHVAIGTIKSWYEWDWPGAGAAFRRALALAPDDADVRCSVGLQEYQQGRLDEALPHVRRAIEMDPLNIYAYGIAGRAARCRGLMAEAEAAFRKTLEISPENVGSRMILAWILADEGRLDEAMAEATAETAEWARLTAVAIVARQAGREEESKQALDRLIESYAVDAAYQVAMVHAVRGEIDAAFEWLERAYAQRDSGLTLLKPEPIFRPLHADPRWRALLAKLGLAD